MSAEKSGPDTIDSEGDSGEQVSNTEVTEESHYSNELMGLEVDNSPEIIKITKDLTEDSKVSVEQLKTLIDRSLDRIEESGDKSK